MLLNAQVVAAFGRQYLARLEDGSEMICLTRGKKSEVVCGDRVEIKLTGDASAESGAQGVIERIAPRRSLLHRSDAFREKLIAANVTQIIVVVAAEPSFSDELLARCLVAAYDQKLDVLVVLNFGANTLDLLRQAASFGLKQRMAVVVVWFSGLDTFQSLGAEVTEGMYFGVQYWHNLDTPGNKAFLKTYKDEFKENPRFYSAADYQIATLMFDAAKRAGSDDPVAMVKALENYTYQGLTGEEHVRTFDHQVVKNYLLVKGKKKSAMKDADDFADVLYSSRSVVTRGESECKMI